MFLLVFLCLFPRLLGYVAPLLVNYLQPHKYQKGDGVRSQWSGHSENLIGTQGITYLSLNKWWTDKQQIFSIILDMKETLTTGLKLRGSAESSQQRLRTGTRIEHF